jgi:hypothetical protein
VKKCPRILLILGHFAGEKCLDTSKRVKKAILQGKKHFWRVPGSEKYVM